MTVAKAIAIHYPCAPDCDNVSSKPNADHGNTTIQAIAEKGFIDVQT
jgi:hypothetical protein